VTDPVETADPAGGSPQRLAAIPDVRGKRQRSDIAAFDFDGTLTSGGSVWRFLAAVAGRPRVVLAAFRLARNLLRAAVFGGQATDAAKEALFRRTLNGSRLAELAPRAAEFGVSHYRHRARSDVRARLEWHRKQGHRLVIVSASPELYVRPVAEELATDVVATRLEVGADGRITGKYEGRNCRGEEKVARLQEWLSATTGFTGVDQDAGDSRSAVRLREPQRPRVWAYGNSAGDVPMLRWADVGVDTGRLGRLGRLRGFRRLTDTSSEV
jgi:phosphatidylglycerophosphatase C